MARSLSLVTIEIIREVVLQRNCSGKFREISEKYFLNERHLSLL